MLKLALAIAVALTSLTFTGAGAEPMTLNVNMFTLDGPTAIARASHAFDVAGLPLTITLTPSSTEQMRGLSNGTFDVAYTAFDNVLAWSGREGAEIIAVAQVDGGVTLPVVVRPEVNDWPDLRGKRLAVDAADTAFALVLRRILQEHGLELNRDYTLVPLGATSARFDSMVRGDTFAAILNPPFNTQAVAAGMIAFGDQHEILPEYPGSVIAVRRDWAQANRDVLVNYLRVWRQAGELSQGEPDLAARLYAAEANIPAATASGLLPKAFNSGRLNLAGLQSVLDLRNRFDYALPMGNELSRFVDDTYWSAAAVSK